MPWRSLALVVLVALTWAGCHGALVNTLEKRHVNSCVWWSNGIFGGRGVTATGGVDIKTCLAVPCQMGRY